MQPSHDSISGKEYIKNNNIQVYYVIDKEEGKILILTNTECAEAFPTRVLDCPSGLHFQGPCIGYNFTCFNIFMIWRLIFNNTPEKTYCNLNTKLSSFRFLFECKPR